ncbi:MAG: hypothetical protein ABFD76_05015 [Smithella sp.]
MEKKLSKALVPKNFIPGKDYYIYVSKSENILSPERKSSSDIRKSGLTLIGGFHTLCADVGGIPGHPLSGYCAGDILPNSVWNLRHRARCLNNDGMVYSPLDNIWVDIYLPSDTGEKTASVFHGNITNNRLYADFAADAKKKKKRLLTHEEFINAANGSNEMTNIKGSTFPGTTGGHVDTCGRRMISGIGCEDMCGVIWQWLSTPDPSNDDLPLLAGGNWSHGAFCGSRFRGARSRWAASTYIGARFASEPM